MITRCVVSRDDTVYQAFPDLVRARSGRLVCVFTACDRHAPRTWARVMCTVSPDEGRTWSQKRPVPLDDAGYICDCARVSLHPDGRLLLVCGASRADGGTVFLYAQSRDEGESWQFLREESIAAIMPDKLTVLPDGRWMLGAQRRSPHPPAQHEEAFVRFSTDEGATWSPPIVVASVPGLWLCEGSLLPLGSGDIACVLRENSGEGYDAYKAVSRDGGRTWGAAHRMPLPGCHRPTCGLLRDGRVLITYRFMQGGSGWLGNWTQNLFAALTDQSSMLADNRRAQWTRILPLAFDRSPRSDTGYSGWAQLDGGDIFAVNYLLDDAPRAWIQGIRFSLGDILAEDA